jgi:hypothetical protein
MGSSDLAVPDFWSLTCGPCIWWDPHVSDSKSGKVRIGKLEDPAPFLTCRMEKSCQGSASRALASCAPASSALIPSMAATPASATPVSDRGERDEENKDKTGICERKVTWVISSLNAYALSGAAASRIHSYLLLFLLLIPGRRGGHTSLSAPATQAWSPRPRQLHGHRCSAHPPPVRHKAASKHNKPA